MKPVLTDAERDILRMVREGKLNKEIATVRFTSVRTVGFILQNIYTKLHVHNRILAYRKAEQLGLI